MSGTDRLIWVDERRGVEMRHDIGVDNIMWSTDFPTPPALGPTRERSSPT
jgi:hypothetical protein